jgi:hypothetical protein
MIVAIGLVFLYGALSDRVILDEQGISLVYPQWFPSILRKGWSLPWQDIKKNQNYRTRWDCLLFCEQELRSGLFVADASSGRYCLSFVRHSDDQLLSLLNPNGHFANIRT